jgi:hypothetical protein
VTDLAGPDATIDMRGGVPIPVGSAAEEAERVRRDLS